MSAKSKSMCAGCYCDDYNHGLGGAKECWSFKSARVVIRFRIGWWTRPDSPGAFTKVTTLSCWHRPGKCAMYDKLPSCAVSK